MKSKKIDACIYKSDGTVLFEKKDFETPESWGDLATTILAEKYSIDSETSVFQVMDRVSNQITEWGKEQGYFKGNTGYDQKDNILPEVFFEKLMDILLNQRALFNSPVMMNLGVLNTKPQTSACFLGTVEDNMEDILEHNKRAGLIFQSGSGIGVNVSKLRAEGELLSNRGKSSGPLSFAKSWDRSASVIKSGGKTRRAAVLIRMDVDHPDIEKFITVKSREEEKAQILIQNGVSEREAYATVDYQNANHSVGVTDEFMQCVEADEYWNLINRGDGSVAKTVKAKDLFRNIAESAWRSGDPGLQFHDTINRDNPLQVHGIIEESNPCGELYGIPWTACQLVAINLEKYVKKDTLELDLNLLNQDLGILVTSLDIMIGKSHYPTKEFQEVAQKSRPLGIGISNLAAVLIRAGVPYSSKKARDFAAYVMETVTRFSLQHSIFLASKLGSFEWFEENRESCLEVMRRKSNLTNLQMLDKLEKYGVRNSQLTTAQPCGTVGLVLGCDSLSIEPLFALKTRKNLSGGGTLELVPKCVEEALGKFNKGTLNDVETEVKMLSGSSADIFKTANDISWKNHIDMVSALQKYISSGVSKTINMPSSATVEDIEEAFMYAWKKGLKGITVYRDGSKEMQPLSSTSKKPKEDQKEKSVRVVEKFIEVPSRKPMPKTRDSVTHKIEVGNFEGYLTVGMYEDGRPGEIWIKASKEGSFTAGLLDSFAIAISFALQYGVPLEVLAKKLKDNKFEPLGWTNDPDVRVCTSIVDYVFQWMEKHFTLLDDDVIFGDDEVELTTIVEVGVSNYDGPPCQDCGGITTRQGTCFVCCTCGTTTGCS